MAAGKPNATAAAAAKATAKAALERAKSMLGLKEPPHAPAWMGSMMQGTLREKMRIRAELSNLKGALPLLMKQRNGGRWTVQERRELQGMLRSASSVSPYLFVWVLPGSVLILPFLAWHLDVRRRHRSAANDGAA